MERTLLELLLILTLGAAALQASALRGSDRAGEQTGIGSPCVSVLEEVERLSKEVRPLEIEAER